LAARKKTHAITTATNVTIRPTLRSTIPTVGGIHGRCERRLRQTWLITR
jgi:hypothetical protein